MVGQSVGQVYYSEISRLGVDNSREIYKLSISILKKLFWIGSFPVFLMVVFGPFIFKTVFGPEWVEAGDFVRILSVLIWARFVSVPLANILNIYEKQKIQFFMNLI